MERAYGLEIPQSLAEALQPNRTALLVYDMQLGILSQIRNGDIILERVLKVLAAARAGGIRTFFCRHLSLPKEAAGVAQLRMAMAWQRVHSIADVKPWFLRDAPGFQLAPQLAPRASEVIFDKITMSAFEATFLDIALRDCGLNTLVIVGVATEVGIEPTVRHAADLGYIPVVVEDACGAGHAEAAERSVATMRYAGDAMFTDVATVSALLARTEMPAASTM
jgi:nicotinamidase-related amidase